MSILNKGKNIFEVGLKKINFYDDFLSLFHPNDSYFSEKKEPQRPIRTRMSQWEVCERRYTNHAHKPSNPEKMSLS
jgi:hypothetical protein